MTYVEKKWVAFIHHTLLHSLCRKPCWQSPLASLVFPQPPVRARSSISVPATQSCARPSATSHVPPPDPSPVPGLPQNTQPRPLLSFWNICSQRRREFSPRLMFSFPISLLDLNLSCVLTQTYWHALCEILFWTRPIKWNPVFLGKS